MCGIVGILGQHEAAPILVDALKRLEYRGYDSAGIATINDGVLDRRRAMGKLVNLADLLVHDPIKGKSGIGHTRWATHGAPSIENAHPHQVGRVAVVHNGIIENFKILRDQLAAHGSIFTTQTDTETIVHLCMRFLDQGDAPHEAARKTIAALDGAFALCFLFAGEDDLMIAARKGSPLAIGHGDGEMFVGSDAYALSPMTDQITYLEEGDWAIITRNTLQIYDEFGNLANRKTKQIQIGQMNVQKGKHRHYMAKEIAEQPVVLGDAVRNILSADRQRVELSDFDLDFSGVKRLTLVACGTAYLACAVAKYWFEQIAKIPVEIDIASEFRYRAPPLHKDNIAIFVSQSGETADTLAALRHCNDAGVRTLGLVNVIESSIGRDANTALPINAGVEIGVASTKAFTCQLVSLLALAAVAARQNNALDETQQCGPIAATLNALPGLMVDALGIEPEIQTAAQELSTAKSALFLGRGIMYPLALEGALKLKEISYIHAEGYASGELKHGPIALVDEHMPVIVFAPKDRLFDKTISNMQEVMARGGKVLLFSDAEGIAEAGNDIWRAIALPKCPDLIAPIIYSVAAQLLAYHTAVHKGTDVDQPRNLAKSVTVE